MSADWQKLGELLSVKNAFIGFELIFGILYFLLKKDKKFCKHSYQNL